MSKGENTVKWIKGQRISSLGHLERMQEDRMPKKIFTKEMEGTRRRGRHRKGWKEEVERDLQVLGVRRWREMVIDRGKWKDIVRQGKGHYGLCRDSGRSRSIYFVQRISKCIRGIMRLHLHGRFVVISRSLLIERYV